jgi:hypothetical protein
MLQTHICVSVHCGQCGDRPNGLESEGHWPTEAAALDAVLADGWQIETSGQLLCPECGPILSATTDDTQQAQPLLLRWHTNDHADIAPPYARRILAVGVSR